MNQNYLFNVDYYEGLLAGSSKYEQMNNILFNSVYEESSEDIYPADHCFTLKTIYPGMLVGIGYPHMAGGEGADKNEEIKLGFSLDYVSGLPYIPGSSIKGVLRSAFRRYPEFIKELMDINDDKIVKLLEQEIFEDGKDVFLDAYPVKANSEGKILAPDYITSHMADDEKYDGLINPVPVRMMKILPSVEILFRFSLKDTILYADRIKDISEDIKLSKTVKLELFKELFLKFGIGAKTNTGYGRLIESETGTNEGIYKWLKINVNDISQINKSDIVHIRKERTPQIQEDDVAPICPCCNNRRVNRRNDGGYFAVCNNCNRNAPLCKQCRQNKVSWNKKDNRWFDRCFECNGGVRRRG